MILPDLSSVLRNTSTRDSRVWFSRPSHDQGVAVTTQAELEQPAMTSRAGKHARKCFATAESEKGASGPGLEPEASHAVGRMP